jgi:uncharacterized protein YrrD
MLITSERLINTPVMSLQTGGQLATTKRPLINPHNFAILAYELSGPSLDEHPSFLRMIDVRELSNLGLIVDSSDEFIGLDDVIKIKEVYDLGFDLIGKNVVDEKKSKMGKVTGYSLEPGTFIIVQINVKRPLLKSFTDTELIIDRTQILEVTNDTITIKNDERQPAPVKKAAQAYTNPFRGTKPQPEAISPDHIL